MEEKRFKKIDGIEALHRILDGERVFDHVEGAYQIKDRTMYYLSKDGIAVRSDMTINAMTMHNDWYIKKPFDVRQAMRDKPDEWVGFYKDDDGISWKVGFEVDSFQAVAIPYGISTKLPLYKKYRELGNWSTVTKEELEKCIPIEDGPEESKIYGMKPGVAICDEEATR
jgi:hypothetical protein